MLLQFTARVIVPNDIVVLDRFKLIEQIESILSFYYGYTKIIEYDERVPENEITERH